MASDSAVREVSACIFDVYGTLLDVNSAVRREHGALGPLADLVAGTWRTKQLEYAWTASLAGAYVDFWTCTAAALEHALALHGADSGCRDLLLEAYRTIDPFDDAALTLKLLGERGIRTAILSNGTSRMLDDALRAAGLTDLLEAQISIEEAGIYKPARAAYDLATTYFDIDAASIGFVSSNAWDVAGALRSGFVPIWVNRHDAPNEYGLLGNVHQVDSLVAVSEYFRSLR